MKNHHYKVTLNWTGNEGTGTSGYGSYSRKHEVKVEGKPVLAASADTPFRGDADRYNPEEMLVASLSSCHMLWYLHLCADAGVIVTHYADQASGILQLEQNGSGRFTEVTLRPVVTVKEAGMLDKAQSLHKAAHQMCFIANSCNFPVWHEVECEVI